MIYCRLIVPYQITTSNDRSINIWKLDFHDKNVADWAACDITEKKRLSGHASRLFRHKIINYEDRIFIVGVEEMNNVCIWALDGLLVSREFIAAGVALYNLVYDSSRQLLFFCGDDGSIHQLHLKNILENVECIQSLIETTHLSSNEYFDYI